MENHSGSSGSNVEYVSGLHQIFKHLDQNQSNHHDEAASVEDLMTSLEETDENFHR